MTFEKRVGVGVVLAGLVQLAAVFMWAGASGNRLAEVEAELERHARVPERLARIEAKLEHLDAQLDRMEARLVGREDGGEGG